MESRGVLLTNFGTLLDLDITRQSLSLLGTLDAGNGELNVLGFGDTLGDATSLFELGHGNSWCDAGLVVFVVQVLLLVDLVLGVDNLLLDCLALDDGLNCLVDVAVNC